MSTFYSAVHRFPEGLRRLLIDAGLPKGEIPTVSGSNDGEFWHAGGPPWGTVWLCEGEDTAKYLLEMMLKERGKAALKEAYWFRYTLLPAFLVHGTCREIRLVCRRTHRLNADIDRLRFMLKQYSVQVDSGYLLDREHPHCRLLDRNGDPVIMKRRARNLPPRLRFEVLQRDGFACVYCGRSPPEVVLHCDHVVPRAKGGSDDPSNLVAACSDCNLGKSDRSLSRNPIGEAATTLNPRIVAGVGEGSARV